MAIEVFNRYENKYMLDESMFNKIQTRLADYMRPDTYNKRSETYTISNLYYDTASSELIRISLAKPRYKEKLRLRGYGVPQADGKVYLEIKKKVNGLVNKRRSTIHLDEAYAFLAGGRLEQQPYMNEQVLHEVSYILRQYELAPALYLAYDRRAWFGADDDELRVSFDSNIRTRRYDLQLEAGDYGEQLLSEGRWLMEIKTAASIPLWLCQALSEYRIYPLSFSKYGSEYKKTLADWQLTQSQTVPQPLRTAQPQRQLVPARAL